MIPASNAGFFTCGHSPLFFAVRVQRVNAVCQLRSSLLTFSFYYTFPLPEYLIVPPIYLHPADALYTPQFGSHFLHGINIISFALKFSISIFVFQFAELLIHHCCTFSFQVSHEDDTAIFGGISSNRWTWSGQASASMIFTPFHSHNCLRIFPIATFFSP